MKKSIKAELVSLAHKILQLRDGADYVKMADHARELNEKLTILAYAEKLENTGKPTIGVKEVEEELKAAPVAQPKEEQKKTDKIVKMEVVNKEVIPDEPALKKSKTPAEILAENQARYAEAKGTDSDHHRPDGTQYNTEEPVHEPVIEKIKDMWPEMTPEAADIDKVIDAIIPQTPDSVESFTIGTEFAQTPIFEPKGTEVEEIDDRPKNLNDRLKRGTFKIGLNDKLSFIKHLFNGSSHDYNRVVSQLETLTTPQEAQGFISEIVKPDYENWKGKESHEERFMEIVMGRYN